MRVPNYNYGTVIAHTSLNSQLGRGAHFIAVSTGTVQCRIAALPHGLSFKFWLSGDTSCSVPDLP